jgi:tRNA(fMet)-specific endonuclease VapC
VRIVLDSNIAIAAMNQVPAVVERLAKIPADDVAIPMAAIAELAFGARRSRHIDQNLGRLAALREAFAAMPVSDAVADRYGEVRADLQTRGLTKSDFDLLIACTALEQDALLVTADHGLLDGVIPGLRSESWLERP